MTTASYPVSGVNFTTSQWRKANGASDGIADCDGTSATDLRLSLSPTTDVATVGLGTVRFENFALQVTTAHGLTLAPAVGVAKTYVVGVMHNPALETDPLGPLRLAAPPKTALGIPSDGALLPLYEVTRAPAQVLSQAAVVDQRSYAGDLLVGTVYAVAALTSPLGSRLYDPATRDEWVRVHNATRTGAVWESMTDPDWTALTVATTQGDWTAYGDSPPKCRLRLGKVELEGAVHLGESPAGYNILRLPVGMRPTQPRFVTAHHSSTINGCPYEVVVNANGYLVISPQQGGRNGGLTRFSTYPISGTFPL